MDRKYYTVNFEKLRDFWHASAVKCFLKAKARALYAVVPQSEYLMYIRCENEAGTAAELAGCVVTLLDARDRLRSSRLLEKINDFNTAKYPFIPGFEHMNEEVRNWVEQLQKLLVKSSAGHKLKLAEEQSIQPAVTFRERTRRPLEAQINLNYKFSDIMGQQYGEPVGAKEYYYSLVPEYISGQFKPFHAKQSSGSTKYTKVYDMGWIKDQLADNKGALTLSRLNEKLRLKEKVHWPSKKSSSIAHKKRRKRQIANFVKYQLNKRLNSTLAKLATAYIRSLLGGNPEEVITENMQKLQIIREYYNKVETINNFVQRMNALNTRFLRNVNLPVESYVGKLKDAKDEPILQDIVDTLNSFQEMMNGKSISIMSPRFLSIIPNRRNGPHRLLSPTIFSFQRDGFLSIPELLKIADSTSAQRYMLEMLLEMSGASTAIDKLLKDTEQSRRQLENIHYPAISKLINCEKNWKKALKSYSEGQTAELNSRGYTYLTAEQLRLIYGADVEEKLQLDADRHAAMNDDEKEEMIEAKIRALAHLAGQNSESIQKTRFKRAHFQNETEHGFFHTFETVAFASYIGYGSALEILTLSPSTFIFELLFPEALGVRTLSPSAFAASVLSPTALTAFILSPTALTTEVLSPRALTTLVLSPSALGTAVLSPHLIQPRVLSPETLVINVLNPFILSPRVASGGAYNLLVLSPAVLSPHLWSKETMIIEILSPHVLGGGEHEDEEKEEKGSEEHAVI